MNVGRDIVLYLRAKNLVIKHQNTSVSFIQRNLKISYTKALELMSLLEKNGIVSVSSSGVRRVNDSEKS